MNDFPATKAKTDQGTPNRNGTQLIRDDHTEISVSNNLVALLQEENRSSADLLVNGPSDFLRPNNVPHLHHGVPDELLDDRRFRRILFNATQGIRILDLANGQYRYISESIEAMIGWSAKEIKEGGLCFRQQITHPWDLKQEEIILDCVKEQYALLSTAEKMNVSYSLDLRVRHKRGGYRRILEHRFPLRVSATGKISCEVILSQDISSHKTSSRMHYALGIHRGSNFPILVQGKTKASENQLSKRETEVLELIAKGMRTAEIAAVLHRSEETIRTHRKNMLAKTRCKNIAALMHRAVAHGWIS